MARNLAELLPAPFDELTLNDVEGIVAGAEADDRESLFFELKSELRTGTLAKTCAAFANTLGGLLVVGVSDAGDVVGIDRPAGEVQLWVKDVLRGNVLPIPPFRARWLPLAGDTARGLLLVLVDESTAAPHLLTRSGAIYVRNPGSSDPLTDQRRLLDLVERGERAERDATVAARERGGWAFEFGAVPTPTEILCVVPTGITDDFEEALFGSSGAPELLARIAWGEPGPSSQERWFPPTWSSDELTIHRVLGPGRSLRSFNIHDGVGVRRDGLAFVYRSLEERVENSVDWMDSIALADARARFDGNLAALREILTDLGAHGRLRVAYTFAPQGRAVLAPSHSPIKFAGQAIVERWTSLEAENPSESVFAEIARHGGLGPE